MNNKKDIIILYFFIVIEFLILINSKSVITSIIQSTKLFIINIFPSLFPTMVIGIFLVQNNIHLIIPKFIKYIFNKLFSFNDTVTSLYIISMLCGTPSNSMFINEYLKKGLIDEKTAENLIYCTHFINPLFVIGTVGIGLFNSFKIGIIILLMLYLSNFIKAFILRNNFTKTNKQNNYIKNENIISTLSNSIIKSINSLLLILGIIIMFNILINLISNIFNLSSYTSTIINGLLEMTSGIIKLKDLHINYYLKIFMVCYFLSFGGICIQLQTLSMLTKKKIRYFKYFIFRLF